MPLKNLPELISLPYLQHPGMVGAFALDYGRSEGNSSRFLAQLKEYSVRKPG
jgi:hypothetical protein